MTYPIREPADYLRMAHKYDDLSQRHDAQPLSIDDVLITASMLRDAAAMKEASALRQQVDKEEGR